MQTPPWAHSPAAERNQGPILAVLQALLATQPEHPFVSKIGRYLTLIRKSDGRYRTTQEAAFWKTFARVRDEQAR